MIGIWYLKFFWLSFLSVWRLVVFGLPKEQVAYETLLTIIADLSFPAWLVKRELLRYCQRNRSEWRLSRLLDRIAETRPKLFQDLDQSLCGGGIDR